MFIVIPIVIAIFIIIIYVIFGKRFKESTEIIEDYRRGEYNNENRRS